MINKTKVYGSGSFPNYVPAHLKWNSEFLQEIANKMGMDNTFTSWQIYGLFDTFMTENAIRLKLTRLYKNGWFIREKRGKLYYYEFSNRSLKYYERYGSFEEGPLNKKIKPGIIEYKESYLGRIRV